MRERGERSLTVGEVAARLGVTVRTLHHWEQRGVACASERSPAGYRLYSAADLVRLQRVIVYRELGLSLERIRMILGDETGCPGQRDASSARAGAAEAADPLPELRAQHERLRSRIARLEQARDGVERMIAAHENGSLLTAEQQRELFGPDWNPDWAPGARARWGDNAQWRQYAERAAGRDADDWAAIARATREIDAQLAAAAADGVALDGAEALALVERHREAFSAYFPITVEMHVCLGRMYEADPVFAAHYDALHPGLASWLRRAIDRAALAAGIDPDRAEWR